MNKIFFGFLMILATSVYAGGSPTPGSLDTTFGSKGVVITAFSARYDEIDDMAIQSDGKIVAVGWSSISDSGFSLARYNTNGSLDTTFGTGGKVSTSFSSMFSTRAHAMAIQSNGKIIAGGGNGAVADIARYNPDGSLDASFDGDGKLELMGGVIGEIADVAVQSDGKIVVVGDYSVLARLNSDGSLDRDFGSAKTGLVSLPFAPRTVAIHTDSRIIVGGNSSSTSGNLAVAARYNADGTADISFGNGGVATAQVPGPFVSSMVVHPLDGFIVLAGQTTVSTGFYNFALVRFGPNGVLDNTFGTGGVVVTAVTAYHNAAQDIALQIVNGAYKYVVSGYAFYRSGRTQVGALALARYNVAGSLDSTFGTSGIVLNPVGTSYAVAIQGDGKIVSGGTTSQSGDPSTYDFILARYNP